MTESHDGERHLLDYWHILLKRRWVIYTAVAVLFVTVTLGSLLMRPVYTATTRLQIEPAGPNILPFQDIMASVPDQRNDFYQTQYGLIQSRRVAREVIDALKLDRHGDFAVRVRPAGGDPEAARGMAAGGRIDLFLDLLKISPVRNSRLVDVSFSSHDRALSARVANRVADTYIAFNTRAEYNTSERATASLTHQIANLQEEIDDKEKELQAYARDNGIVVLNEKQNLALKNLNDLNDAYTRAQAARIEKEARYAAVREAEPGGIPEVMDSKLIQDLTAKSAELSRRRAEMSGKYKPDWPEMVRLRRQQDETDARLQTERRSIHQQVLGAAESAYHAARNQEESLRQALDKQKKESQDFGLKEIQYNNMKAEIANRRATLEALVKRQSETSSTAGLNDLAASNIRIVDAAEVPVRPSSPRILLNIILSLLTGTALGVGLAFFFEYLDKSVKSPEEVHQLTGIGSIGLIPLLRPEGPRLRVIRAAQAIRATQALRTARAATAQGGESAAGKDAAPQKDQTPRKEPAPRVELLSHENPKSKIAEAFRELRTALMVSQPGGPPRHILIASTQPGEGKTVVALNLATTLAQLGRRVLLVDADLRKPRLHRLLGVPNDTGLSSCLSGAGRPWPEPRATPVPGLMLLPSGPLPPNPADLLDSERFALMQREIEAQGYDHVVYDSPPILAVADPTIMAGRMDAALLVVYAGITGRDALRHAVERLRQVKARIIGGVLNKVDFDEQSYYHYGYSYKRYYGDEAEVPGPPAAGPPDDAAAGPGRTIQT